MGQKIKNIFGLIVIIVSIFGCSNNGSDLQGDSRFEYGKEKLNTALDSLGVSNADSKIKYEIDSDLDVKESFSIDVVDSVITIKGADAAGLLYGSLEMEKRIKKTSTLPETLSINEIPQMSLRGVCILLMKLGTYNYPVTPEEFPFFYDKKLWIDYLDFLAENRFNYIAFWNGHPFAYFTKLDKYPEAQEGMPEGLVEKNNEILHWLITESQKRNIKLIFEFYNIHTSVYFQQAHELEGEISKPTELLKEYTSYCIEKFVNEFPQVGLYITAGEALDHEYSVEWVNHTILDAVKRTGKQPQIMLRSWFLDFESAQKILDYYPDIYIERKYNVEMIADTLIDPENKKWADLSGNYVVNIHMAANLEPFRWNPPAYIQKCMQSSVSVGSNGIHLYPRKSWRWPYNCEINDESFQWERDKLWFEMWGRYAWNSNRKPEDEKKYWQNYFSDYFGSENSGKLILNSFETNADVLPAIQRLFWAGNDNHTVVTSGLMLNQILRAKGVSFLNLKPVTRISDYLESVSKGTDLPGISPIEFLDGKVKNATMAVKLLEDAIPYVQKNKSELDNYLLDARAVELTSKFYLEKLKAAKHKIRIDREGYNKSSSEKFLKRLKKSVDYYKELTGLTLNHYESISDVWAIHPVPLKVLPFHWKDLLPAFEKEYDVYKTEYSGSDKPENNLPKFNGLIGVVYGSPDLVNPKIEFTSNNLELDWNTNPPDDGRNWSALLTGFIRYPVTGDITFHITSEQHVKFIIDGKVLLNKTDRVQEESITVKATTGTWHSLIIEYDNIDYVGSNLEILWSLREGEKTSISSDCLMHSEQNRNKAERTVVLGF